jgi:hypothetical protein
MHVDLIIWDDQNEPHITAAGEVTVEDVEEVIRNHPRPTTIRTTTATHPAFPRSTATHQPGNTSWSSSRISATTI